MDRDQVVGVQRLGELDAGDRAGVNAADEHDHRVRLADGMDIVADLERLAELGVVALDPAEQEHQERDHDGGDPGALRELRDHDDGGDHPVVTAPTAFTPSFHFQPSSRSR